MERFRSKLNFWKKVEKKAPQEAENTKKGTPTLTPAKTHRSQPQTPPKQETPAAVAASGSEVGSQPQLERRSEQLGHNYPAKPLPRPGGNAYAPPGQYGAGVRASMPASVAAQMASAPPAAGARGSVPNARQMSSSASVGVQKGRDMSAGGKKGPPSAGNAPVQQQRPSGAPANPGARSRASMPTAPSQGRAQPRAPAARMSMQPGALPQAGSRGQLPQPPGGERKIPSVRGSQPPIRPQQRQQQQQRGGGRGPLPTPPPGAAAAVSRGPLPAAPGASVGAPAAKPPVIKAQVRAPQALSAKKAPVNPQRQSVQPRANPAQVRLNAQQIQRQSMPHMNKQASATSTNSMSSSRPPSKPQPAPPTKSSSGPPKKAVPAPMDKSLSSAASATSNGSSGGIKPIVIADVFKQGSSQGSSHSGTSMSRRERRKEAGDEKDLLQDITAMAKSQPKSQPKRAAPAAPSGDKSFGKASSAPIAKVPSPAKTSSVSADDFFIPIAALKEQQSRAAQEPEDRPPTPPPRSPDGDRSHRSQRTAAPKIPAREPAPGEKRQTGFMSRIKSVFGSSPVIPQQEEQEDSSSTAAAAAAGITTGAVAGAAAAGVAASKSSSKSTSQAKAASVSQLPPTPTAFDSATIASESASAPKGKAKSKSKNKSVTQRASQATNKLSSSMHGMISPRGKSSAPAPVVGPAYGLSEQQQKILKPEQQEALLREQLGEIDDKIQANSRTKEGLQKMAELSATNDPMFEAQLMDLNTMLAQLMEARSRIATQLEKTGAIAPRTPVLSARSADSGRSREGGSSSGSARRPTLTRAGSSVTNLRARFYRSVGSQTAQHPQQLDTRDGDVLTMVWRAPTGWWKMGLNGVEGYVHSQYCEAIPDDEGEKAIAIQKARQPAVDCQPEAAAEPSQASSLAASQPVASVVPEKRKTVVPKAVVKSESSVQPSTQRRMTMPLPQQPNGGNGGDHSNSTAHGSSSGSKAAAFAVTPKVARASASAQASVQPEPQPQKPSYPQAKVIFAFEKSTPTEIGIGAGLQVSIIEVAGEWSYILHEPTANAGYIPNSYLEKL